MEGDVKISSHNAMLQSPRRTKQGRWYVGTKQAINRIVIMSELPILIGCSQGL